MHAVRLTLLGLAASLAAAACGSSGVDSATPAPAAAAEVANTTPPTPPTAAASTAAPTTPAPADTVPAPAATEPAVATTAAPTLNLLDTALENGSFNVLSSLLGTADLIGTLDGDGPFTVFAPTDDAFAGLPPGLIDALGRPDNRDALVRVLTYHVIAGRLPGSSVVAGPLVTLEGSSATVVVDGGVRIDAANVTATDVQATNGVIHVLDAVLLPPNFDVAAVLAPPATQAPRPKTTTVTRGTDAPHSTDAPAPQPPAPQPPAPQPTDAPHST